MSEGIARSGLDRFRAAYSPTCDIEIVSRRAAAPGESITPEMLEVIRAVPGIEEYTDVPSGRTLHTMFRQVHIRERSNRSHITTYSLLQGGNPASHARIAIWGGAEYASGNAAQSRCELRDMPPPSWDAYVKARDSGMIPPELERAGLGCLELATFLTWAFDQAGGPYRTFDPPGRHSRPGGWTDGRNDRGNRASVGGNPLGFFGFARRGVIPGAMSP
ncbi:MAG TPA: hypothetical protein PKU91_05990 [Phycisphaerales bacterium]|nr:hypothetical protein [Phycisphaerales bacterium]